MACGCCLGQANGNGHHYIVCNQCGAEARRESSSSPRAWTTVSYPAAAVASLQRTSAPACHQKRDDVAATFSIPVREVEPERALDVLSIAPQLPRHWPPIMSYPSADRCLALQLAALLVTQQACVCLVDCKGGIVPCREASPAGASGLRSHGICQRRSNFGSGPYLVMDTAPAVR
jgi:hypothetical protein